jgi:hypothetical protein
MRIGDAEDEHGEDGEHVLSAELLAGGENRTIVEDECWVRFVSCAVASHLGKHTSDEQDPRL